MIKLYHGTNVKFGLLDPSKSRDGLDFGKGGVILHRIRSRLGAWQSESKWC